MIETHHSPTQAMYYEGTLLTWLDTDPNVPLPYLISLQVVVCVGEGLGQRVQREKEEVEVEEKENKVQHRSLNVKR